MYSFAKMYGLKYFVSQEQYNQLTYYFKPETMALSVVEHDLPHYYTTIFGRVVSRLYWEKPWQRIDQVDNNFHYNLLDNKELHTGMALDIGDFPNDIQHYAPYLSDLRQRFTLKERFTERAEDLLQSELMSRNMMGSDITWVGVHNRRGDYGVINIYEESCLFSHCIPESPEQAVRTAPG